MGVGLVTLAETLVDVWRQVMIERRTEVELGELRYRVDRTRNRRLRTVGIRYEGFAIEGIEQNPETSSRWAQLAKEGQRVMQFSCGGAYVANVAEGRLTRYPAWKAAGLPE